MFVVEASGVFVALLMIVAQDWPFKGRLSWSCWRKSGRLEVVVRGRPSVESVRSICTETHRPQSYAIEACRVASRPIASSLNSLSRRCAICSRSLGSSHALRRTIRLFSHASGERSSRCSLDGLDRLLALLHIVEPF